MSHALSRRMALATTAMAAVAVAGGAGTAAAKEKQTRMRRALYHLAEGRRWLKEATTDKGGHRKKAIRLTENAIQETKLGIRYDNLF